MKWEAYARAEPLLVLGHYFQRRAGIAQIRQA
jgi:hypothetical protein